MKLIRSQDTNFLTINKNVLSELAELIETNNLQFKMYIETRPEGINSKSVELLKKLNVDGVGMGIELSTQSFREDKLRRFADTEKIIGNWFSKTGNRDKVILATKIAGPGDYTAHIRKTRFKGNSINEAVEGSLKRLQTDYIDLYQLHWPERITNTFGNRSFQYFNDSWEDNFEEYIYRRN